ncbi:MAG: FAD-binding oxidoreductase [Halanaerobium sp.]|nr:FAD-binding oxidoreductase [Halanaerobium sp.]
MKNKADVVIIGGGVVGCSIAYNLARDGVQDVVLLEKDYLAAGSTGRCGAGVRQQWGTETNCRLAQASIAILEELEERLDYHGSIEFKQGGYLLLALTEKEWNQFQENVKLQNRLGIPSRLLTPVEAKEIVPHLNIEDNRIYGATFCPTDGHANPFKVTEAYAIAAKRLGVEINKYTEALDIKVEKGRITGVLTSRGLIKTDTVVNAAGGYSQDVAAMAGIDLPVYSERHQILVTEPVEPLQGPMVMSFSGNFYIQQTPHGSFIMGQGDPNEPKGYDLGHSWQFLTEMTGKAIRYLPLLGQLRVVRQWSGLYNITPDAQPIICQVSELPGYYLAAGYSGHGFMLSPITGELISEMIRGKATSIDISMLDLGRFARGELFLEPSVV